ncbi:MAG: branched-chain amino acid ABC transporter permease [Clostridiaceae bacterium]|nr:branched-chain amino acid ABC transporter permease [Clostridiaceae bacterium]
MNFLIQLMNGLEMGSIYVLVALGYTMVYGIVKLINFAHGDIIMVGGYFLLTAATLWGMPIWVAVIFTIIACAVLGIVIEKVAYKPLRNSARISSLITAIGVSLFLQNLFMLIYKPDPRTPPKVFSSMLNRMFGKDKLTIYVNGDIPYDISYTTLLTIIVSVIIMLGLHFFVKKTKVGKAMLAVSEDAGAAQLMGISVNTIISVTFAIGSALAAVGAIFYTSIVPQVSADMGSMLGLKAFVAAVLGGIGIIPGAMIGGLIMGVAESLTRAYISSNLSDAIVFGILILVLLVKPSGILGKNVKEKV